MLSDPRDRPLDRVDPDPLRQFAAWLEEARAAGVPLPEAVTVATTGPSARMVLLKSFDERGFVFASSYASRKARELERDPRATLLFYWHALGRQVRIEGAVERTSAEESEAIHRDRPRASQLAAWASRQSEPLASRDELEEEVRRYEREFAGRDVPLPERWGGYRLLPDAFEFWQHRESRLHDRFRYLRTESGWRIDRLAP